MDDVLVKLENGWKEIQEGINRFVKFLEDEPGVSYTSDDLLPLHIKTMDLCTIVPYEEIICGEFYKRSKLVIVLYIDKKVTPSLKAKKDKDLLEDFLRRWSTFQIMLRETVPIFAILGPYIDEHSLIDLYTLGHQFFHLLVYDEFITQVKDATLLLINEDRKASNFNYQLLKELVNVFMTFGDGSPTLYESDFEHWFLRSTTTYYSEVASQYIKEDNVQEYLIRAEQWIKYEEELATCLHKTTRLKLLQKVRQEVLFKYGYQLIDDPTHGFDLLLKSNQVENLKMIFNHFQQYPQMSEKMGKAFKKFIEDDSKELVKQSKQTHNKKGFMMSMFKLHDKYFSFGNDCFTGNSHIYQALNEVFEIFCKISKYEFLASFAERIVVKGDETDGAINRDIEKIITLLVRIHDRDYFRKLYRTKLAQRLLCDKNANVEREITILTKLKQQLGWHFTSKMEGMVTDVTLAREKTRKSFEEYLNQNPRANLGIDLTVTVLNSVTWPSYRSSDLNLPAELVNCVGIFSEFYQTITKHRKLKWMYSLGSTCTINGMFELKTMELVVTTYQASALLLFNASDILSFTEIMAQLNLTNAEVARALQSLSCGKYKILNKEPNDKIVSPTDYFEFNSKFTDKMSTIKIPPHAVDEKKMVTRANDKEHNHSIDVSIVQIMKSRRTLDHQQLVTLCVEKLGHHFTPDSKAIKRRIEELMYLGYLQRSKDDPNKYEYLA